MTVSECPGGLSLLSCNDSGGGSGTVDEITSNGGSITVTNPTGPIVNIEVAGGGSGITLKTDGTPNALQTTLNLISGINITLTADMAGGVTIDASGGTGSPGGVQYDVQLNDGAGGFAGSNNLNFQGGYLTINGDSGYGQLQFLNTPASVGYGGAGINGTDNQIIVGALDGDLSIWCTQAISLSSDSGATDMLQVNGDGTVYFSSLSASELVATDGSKNLQSLTTATYPSLTEISYVKGVTSAIQTQLNSKGSGTVTSVSGTSNRITSTGGATPVIDISAAYVGQSSITTLGTVGTGVWQGTKIGLAYGGTNADLSGTGGASQVLKQASSGAAVTVGQLAASDLSNGTTGSGAVVLAGTPTLTTAVLGSSTATTQSPADNSTKLATTAYVDNAILGQRQKEAVKYASTAALPSIIYANGSSGVGATLTGVALAAISLDGSSPSLSDRVLIKNQASDFQNGIYTVTQTGSGIAVFILTRALDFDQASDIQTGDTVFVTAGSTLTNTTWTYNGIDSPTMGTTSITFAQAAGQGSFTGGNGITITGTSIAIDTSVTVDKTTSQVLTNKTLTAPVMTAPVLGTPASGVATNLTGTASGLTAGAVTNATLTTALTVNTGTLTLTANVANTSVLTIGAGAVSVSGSNTGDQTTVSGNAGTATALQNARTIGGVSFDGTGNIVPQTIQSVNEATDTTCFPLFISASGTQSLQPLNNTALTFNSNTGVLGATTFSGAGTSLTGTAASLTAGNVTTNANLTGPVTSSGNATTLITSIPFSAPSTVAVGNATVYLVAKSAFAGTINTLLAAQTTSGTITAAIKINGTNVTGLSAVAVTSTPADTNATAANTFAIGDIITLVTSSASTDLGLSFNLKITRT